jgi:hypothetical protein
MLLTMTRVRNDPLGSVRRKITSVKCRFDEEPPTRWISINADREQGTVSIDRADPYEATRERPRDAHRDDLLAALTETPQAARALAKAIGYNDAGVRRLLKEDLANEGLAEDTGMGWVRGTAAPPAI